MPHIVTTSVRFLVSAILTGCLVLGGASAFAGDGKVNLNTATIEQLEALKGIGPELAKRIVTYRTDHGPFRSIDDLTNVKGIGAGKLSRLRGHLTVETADPIAISPSHPGK